MNKGDYDRFCSALGVLAEIHDKNLSKFAITAYFETLRDHPIDAVESAISRAMGSLKWWPKPVELIELITGGPQDLEDLAQLQAQEVLKAVRRVGAYKSVRFSDQVTAAVVSQGFNGWPRICEMPEAESKWFVRDFVKLYQTYSRQDIKQAEYLPGISEIENGARYEKYDEPPIKIGGDQLKQLPNQESDHD